MDTKKAIFLVIGVFVILGLVYLFYGSRVASAQNAVNIFYQDCNSCSNGAVNIIQNLFYRYGSPLYPKNTSFNTNEGRMLVSNYSVTALPSIIINKMNSSENALDSLVYLNMFNVNGKNFVLNTPFLSGLTKGITYFDLIQNRTVTAFDIFNQSEIYANSSVNFINPSEILYLSNGTEYSSANKTVISFIYSNSSFSAVQSLILYSALNGFGNFTNLSTLTSPLVSFSQGESLGNTQFYALDGRDYRSAYFSLQSSYLGSLGSSDYVDSLEKQLFEFDQNAVYPFFNNIGNFMPFLDIGGNYIEVSSMLNPKIFQGKTINQINQLVRTNKTAGEDFNDSVRFMQTLLCSYTGYNSAVCSSTAVKSDLNKINSLI